MEREEDSLLAGRVDSVPASPTHGSVHTDQPEVGNNTLHIYSGSASKFESIESRFKVRSFLLGPVGLVCRQCCGSEISFQIISDPALKSYPVPT